MPRFARLFPALLALLAASCSGDPESERRRVLERAYKALWRQDYPEAVARFDEAIQRGSNGPLDYFSRGQAHLGRKDYPRALADFHKALEINPDDSDTLAALLNACLSSTDREAAFAAYDRLEALLPRIKNDAAVKGWIAQGRGKLLLEAERPAEAIRELSQSIRLLPDQAFTFRLRARAYVDQKEYGKAIADADRALGSDARDAWSYLIRGQARYYTEDYDAALADLDRAIAYDPTDATAYRQRSAVRMARKQLDEALADCSRAVGLAPAQADGYLQRGIIQEKRGDYAAALADYEEAQRRAPDDSEPLNGLAWVLATCPEDRWRDGKQAVAYATRACERSQWIEANRLDTLAAALAEVGDFDGAVRRQEQAVARKFESASAQAEAEARLQLYREHKPYRLPH
jgi:tetratricopeptide (TPR) repeat protein